MDINDFRYKLARLKSAPRRRWSIIFATYGIPLLIIVLIFQGCANPILRNIDWAMAILGFALYALGMWCSSYLSSTKCKQSFEALIEKKKTEALACQESDETLKRLHHLVPLCVMMNRHDLADQISTLALKCASELPNLSGDKWIYVLSAAKIFADCAEKNNGTVLLLELIVIIKWPNWLVSTYSKYHEILIFAENGYFRHCFIRPATITEPLFSTGFIYLNSI